MPKRSKKKSKQQTTKLLDPTRFFGKNRRYVESFAQGPSPIGYYQVAAYENRVRGYVSKAMLRIGNIVGAWHGTSETAIAQIASTGLLTTRRVCGWGGGLFGSGVYTAPTAHKAFGHAQKHSNFSGMYFLLKCNVALGQPYHPNTTGDLHHIIDGINYHSVHATRGSPVKGVWGGSLIYDEYVVYNPEQVTVDQVFVYKKSPQVRKVQAPSRITPTFGTINKPTTSLPPGMSSHSCKVDGKYCINACMKSRGKRSSIRTASCILPDIPGKRMGRPKYCNHFEARSTKHRRN